MQQELPVSLCITKWLSHGDPKANTEMAAHVSVVRYMLIRGRDSNRQKHGAAMDWWLAAM